MFSNNMTLFINLVGLHERSFYPVKTGYRDAQCQNECIPVKTDDSLQCSIMLLLNVQCIPELVLSKANESL